MDYELLRAVRQYCRRDGVSLSRCARCALAGIALFKRKNSEECSPAVSKIARMFSYSRDEVWVALDELEGQGIIRWTERTDANGRKRPIVSILIGDADGEGEQE